MGFLYGIPIILLMAYRVYRKREVDERHLYIQLLGYYLLGAFTISTTNGFPLPIGFLFSLLLKPKTNYITKKKAAKRGLIVGFIMQIIISAIRYSN